jgi:UDP-N-acetylglucosamine transferase subunit ALG13
MADVFITAGTQLPFDRLVQAADAWASKNKHKQVVAQATNITFQPKAVNTVEFLSPQKYKEIVSTCSVFVGHAGIGTIITAHEFNLPLILFPRKFSLGEHRNDHQSSTAERFADVSGIYIANDADELCDLLDKDDLQACSNEHSDIRKQFVDQLGQVFERLI